MGISRDMKNGFGSLIHPGSETSRNLDVIGALKVYYSVAIIPFILFLIVGMVWFGAYGPTFYNCSGASASGIACGPARYFSVFGNFVRHIAPVTGGVAAVILADIVFLLVVPPIGIFVDSLIYQLIGKNFLREFKKDWSKTFTGVMYGALPALSLYWLLFIPVFGYVVLAIVAIWGFLNATIAIANQQKITRLQSFGVYLVTLFIILLITLVVGSAAISSLASAPVYGPVLP